MRKAVILGSGTCVPSLERSSCAVLLWGEEENILLDIGPGTMHRLLRAGLHIHEIDGVVLSHFHPDHAGEFPPFLFATRFPEQEMREKKLRVLGGTGLGDFYKKANETFAGYLELTGGLLELTELEDSGKDAELFCEFDLEWAPAEHRPESRSYRFTTPDGFVVVYSGDTDYTESLVELARGADLFICESAFPDELKLRGHLSPSVAGSIAEEAGAGHLVLTHFYPICEDYDMYAECRRSYSGRITLAEDLMQFDLTKGGQ